MREISERIVAPSETEPICILFISPSPVFCVVFACYEAPIYVDCLPAAMVVDTDPGDKPGGHRLAFFQETTETMEIIDSYGKNLAHYDLLMLAEDKKIRVKYSSFGLSFLLFLVNTVFLLF